jgi:hypothetical protein
MESYSTNIWFNSTQQHQICVWRLGTKYEWKKQKNTIRMNGRHVLINMVKPKWYCFWQDINFALHGGYVQGDLLDKNVGNVLKGRRSNGPLNYCFRWSRWKCFRLLLCRLMKTLTMNIFPKHEWWSSNRLSFWGTYYKLSLCFGLFKLAHKS